MERCKALESRVTVWFMLRQLAARRYLASVVNANYKPALKHQCNGIARGAEVYRHLYRDAEQCAKRHSAKWKVSMATLHSVLPALEHLRILADSSIESD